MPMAAVANLPEGTRFPLPVAPMAEPSEQANPAIVAMRELQEALAGVAEQVGLDSEEAVVAYVKEIRHKLAKREKHEGTH